MRTKALYLITLILIICVSYLSFSPSYLHTFNSDNAIHVLMANDFELPRDLYFWGQDRLGSLLPLCAYILKILIPISAVLAISITHYIFLLVSFVFLSTFIKEIILRVILACFIFLPIGDFNFLILVGHPYSSQLLIGCMFMYYLNKLNCLIKENQDSVSNFKTKLLFYSLMSNVLLSISIWISEYSIILLLFTLIFLVMNSDTRGRIIKMTKTKLGAGVISINIVFGFFGLTLYNYAKNTASFQDTTYEYLFVRKLPHFIQNATTVIDRIQATLSFRNGENLEGIFFLGFTLLILLFLTYLIIKSNTLKAKKYAIHSIVYTIILGILLLFSSIWMYKNNIRTQYFTPLYILTIVGILIWIQQIKPRIIYKLLMVIFVFTCSILNSIEYLKTPSKINSFSDFKTLNKGILMGDFWTVYLAATASPDSLTPVPYEDQTVRNHSWVDEIFSTNERVYITENYLPMSGLNNIIYHFGYILTKTNKSFKLSETTLHEYQISSNKPIHFFRLKTWNGSYLVCNGNRLEMTFDSENPNCIFELENNKIGNGIKCNNGKFLSVVYNNETHIISANSSQVYDEQRFYFLQGGNNNKIAIQSSFQFTKLTANPFRNQVTLSSSKIGEWEVFELEVLKKE